MPSLPLPQSAPLNVPQTLAQALALHKQGKFNEAAQLYLRILASRPDHIDALQYLALIRYDQAQYAEALQYTAKAMQARAPSPQILMHHGLVLNALNRPAEAIESFDRAIKLKSKFAEAHNNRAVVLMALGRHDEALEGLRKALSITPSYVEAISNQGNVYIQLGRHEDALKSFDRALVLRPTHVESLFNRGNVLKDLRRHEEALTAYNRVLTLRPDFPEALCNKSAVLSEMQRYADGLPSADRAIALRPDYVEALYNRAGILYGLRRFEEALASYDKAVAIFPGLAEAWCNRGNSLRELKRFDEAMASYDRAVEIRPDFADALSNRSMILHDYRRYDEALASCDRALAARPDHINALNNRAESLRDLKRFEEAMGSFKRLSELQPGHPHAFSGAASCAVNLCDWDKRAEFWPTVESHIRNNTSVISAFAQFGYTGDPALQRQCAANYVEHRLPVMPEPMWKGEKWRHDKPRIAYLSADFREHATAFLMAGLFEQHDRARFETFAFSFSTNDRTAMRARLVSAFDEFHDVYQSSDIDVARMLREREIDIAIDLKGHTQESRIGIFAHRPAPIAVSYLGYPATVGTPLIDYFIGDPVASPFSLQPHFDEKIVQLPDSYQCNDRKRVIAERIPSRAEAGLPEHGFVFCSFNNNWKITPEVFDVWMGLLRDVDGSTLWLLRDNEGAEKNLRNEAQRRDIDPARLVFADRALPADHLARHRLADLFLDTLPCNAHTTASDALWAGLPVLTCLGESFAGRVAASLNHAAGMADMVTSNLDAYHALALKLAREPATLAAVKSRLAQNRDTCALFDTVRFARHIEAAYMTMWERWQRDEEPASFAVPAQS
ncbi:tetratricopeptide repeat protein [Rhodoplanes sp. Z2-YC6860]|uniref:tetratricopeptide repeat protein n=1 Tax=Rhodoplanes sp. Z2-YC6860 TaxID=674703 RepID=UPI00078D5790|nr:tetratricopeptide repeat protein [Rhodoplanes sp. Z2-YC6860]AMN38582.1 TPR repeat-containing protein [Rhodoplanes sp. Z2-YC6860]